MAGVDLFDARVGDADASAADPYNIVLTWTNFPYADPNAMGDVLADYQDSGAGLVIPLVVQFLRRRGFYHRRALAVATSYSPFTIRPTSGFRTERWARTTPGHPLMQGVTALGTNFGQSSSRLASGATQVAAWNTGTPLIAFKNDVVAINGTSASTRRGTVSSRRS